MVQKAGDLPWVANPVIRKATVVYCFSGENLTVHKTKDNSNTEVDMGRYKVIMTEMVMKLQGLQWMELESGLVGYDRGLYNYLVRMLGVLWPWLRDRKWTQVGKTLCDFTERERLNFDHSPDGRLKLEQYRSQGKAIITAYAVCMANIYQILKALTVLRNWIQ